MDTLICPYCDSEVKISMVEAEEGCCPECGSSISTAASYNSYNDDYEESGELDDDVSSYDEDDEDNDFADEFDDDIDEDEYDDDDDDKYV